MRGQIRLICGTANEPLAKEVAKSLHAKLTPVELCKFSDSETYVRIQKSIRGKDVFIIQPTSEPVNDNLMELLLMIDALKRASAGSICAIIPYFGYARQDRKATSREPISAKLVANLICKAGANRVMAVDLHASQIQGFFDIPLDHLEGLPLFANYLKRKKVKNAVVVSPDVGGVKINRSLAQRLGLPLVMIYKRRSSKRKNTVVDMKILGDVKGKNVFMIDDMIDTAGTIIKASEVLRKAGAKDIYVCATHGVLSGEAIKNLKRSSIKEVVITNTIDLPKEKRIPMIKVLSIGPIIAGSIKIINTGRPMGVFLDNL